MFWLQQFQTVVILQPTSNVIPSASQTRKSSCVNARGIPTAAYQVLHPLSYPGGGERVPILARGKGYLPWLECTYPGRGEGYLPWPGGGIPTLAGGGIPTLAGGRGTYSGREEGHLPWPGEGYLPWLGEGYLPWLEGGVGYLPGLGEGYLPWLGGRSIYPGQGRGTYHGRYPPARVEIPHLDLARVGTAPAKVGTPPGVNRLKTLLSPILRMRSVIILCLSHFL